MKLTIPERLIVAADFSPTDYGGIKGVEQKVLSLQQYKFNNQLKLTNLVRQVV